jgi:hypothetical protein
MENGQNGIHGALVNQIVDSLETELVTPQLLCLVEQIVLETTLSLVLLIVMEVIAVLVRKYYLNIFLAAKKQL